MCGRLMSPAQETQSMREIRLLRGRLPRKGGGLTGMEEYRIFRTINLDKNDDFVHSTKNVYLYFAVGLFLNKKTRIIDVLGVIFF